MAEISNPMRCRLCFQKQFQLLPMFPANEPVNDDLLRKIQECASVRIVYQHDQNSVICIKCIVDVEQFHSFKERCMKNDRLLLEMREGWDDRAMDEDDLERSITPQTEFIEPVTNLGSPQVSTAPFDAFLGPSKLVRIGYNYRVLRVNDATDVLIYHKHKFCRPESDNGSQQWICLAKRSTGCPAALTISSSVDFPLALFTKPIHHNHSEATVPTIGSVNQHDEEIVKIHPKYTLALDGGHRLRMLAGGYSYRLRQALFGAGRSLWTCVRSECSAKIEISYEDGEYFLQGEETHCHDAEENVPLPTGSVNSALMAQKKSHNTSAVEYGYNYYVNDGNLIHRGHTFVRRNMRQGSSKAGTGVWHCSVDRCAVKVRVRRKTANVSGRAHDHPRESLPETDECPIRRTLRQGANYRLVVEGNGFIRLCHRKQKYFFQSANKNGTTEWACTWKRLGCKSILKMLPDEQVVYECTIRHEHRIRNALEQYFVSNTTSVPSADETNLWTSSNFELLWNRNGKPIVRRNNNRYYARKAFANGTVEWHCVRSMATQCKATLTIDKSGDIAAEQSLHDHEQSRKGSENGTIGGMPNIRDIIASSGPVRLLAGGFNYRRMLNVPLNLEIVMHVAHTYLSTSADSNTYRCIFRDKPNDCPGSIVLTNNALCAEATAPHNHLARSVPKLAEPDRCSQVAVDGPNFQIIYSMTGRNCLLTYEGNIYRIYKLLEPTHTSRWRCLRADAGCKAYLSVPLSLTIPAKPDDQPHNHLSIGHDTRGIVIKREYGTPQELLGVGVDNGRNSLRLRARDMAQGETLSTADLNGTQATTSDEQQQQLLVNPFGALHSIKQEFLGSEDDAAMENDPSAPFRLRSLVIPKREPQMKPDPDGMTYFLNGHLYVRQFEDLETIDTPEWICAFRWTLGCNTRLSDLMVHDHERFASVRTNDRFSMLKTLISRGFIGQRGAMTLLPERQTVSSYELLPSNGNLSLIIDEKRYYFYKAKNNGEWLWRCVRHRWQGCKIGVAVSHCFGKYYYQPYGKTEHEHS